jgi:hypothetical protein
MSFEILIRLLALVAIVAAGPMIVILLDATSDASKTKSLLGRFLVTLPAIAASLLVCVVIFTNLTGSGKLYPTTEIWLEELGLAELGFNDPEFNDPESPSTGSGTAPMFLSAELLPIDDVPEDDVPDFFEEEGLLWEGDSTDVDPPNGDLIDGRFLAKKKPTVDPAESGDLIKSYRPRFPPPNRTGRKGSGPSGIQNIKVCRHYPDQTKVCQLRRYVDRDVLKYVGFRALPAGLDTTLFQYLVVDDHVYRLDLLHTYGYGKPDRWAVIGELQRIFPEDPESWAAYERSQLDNRVVFINYDRLLRSEYLLAIYPEGGQFRWVNTWLDYTLKPLIKGVELVKRDTGPSKVSP